MQTDSNDLPDGFPYDSEGYPIDPDPEPLVVREVLAACKRLDVGPCHPRAIYRLVLPWGIFARKLAARDGGYCEYNFHDIWKLMGAIYFASDGLNHYCADQQEGVKLERRVRDVADYWGHHSDDFDCLYDLEPHKPLCEWGAGEWSAYANAKASNKYWMEKMAANLKYLEGALETVCCSPPRPLDLAREIARLTDAERAIPRLYSSAAEAFAASEKRPSQTLASLAGEDGQAQPPAEASEPNGANLDTTTEPGDTPGRAQPIGVGMAWRKAKDKAEGQVKRSGWPGVNALAQLVGCSSATMRKAIENSTYLKARKTEQGNHKGVRERRLTDATLEDQEQSTEGQPDELASLIEEQKADDQRGKRQHQARKRQSAR